MVSRRAVFSLVNTALLGSALAVWFLYPQYAVYLVYVLAAWIGISLAVAWSSVGTRRSAPTVAPGGPRAPTPVSGSTASPASAATGTIDFCIYCGTKCDPGERRCRACGHPLRFVAAPG